MAEETERNDWSQRIDRALSGTTLEQFREMVDRLRDDLSSLPSRDDLVRGLEAVAAAQRSIEIPAIDGDVIERAVAAQAERILGGFAQRVGQLQTAINQTQEMLLDRIERLEGALAAQPEAPPAPTVDIDALSERVEASVGDVGDATRSMLADVVSAVEQLSRRVESLAAAPPPAVVHDDGETAERALAQVRDELRSLDVTLRTEIDAGFRARDEADTKQADALGLRVTNLSMSVTQAIEAVRAQVAGMQERAERLEAEQAAILGAIRSEVAGIGGTVAGEVTDGTQELIRTVTEHITTLQAQVSDRLAVLEEPMRAASEAREDLARVASLATRVEAVGEVGERLALLDQVLERVHALEGIDDRLSSAISAAVEPVTAMRDDLREVADQAIQLGALPQIEAQLRRVEEAVSAVGGIRERLEAFSGLSEQLDALGPITEAIERVQGEVAAIPSMREQLRALAERPADSDALDAIAASVAPLAGTGDRLDAIAERLGSIDEIADRLGALTRLDDVAQMLAQVGARLDELPETAAAAIASRIDGVATELWTIVERLPAAVDERMHALRDRIEQRLEGLHVDLGDVERVREIVDGMLSTARANEQRLIETAAQVDTAAAEMRDEVGRALSRVSVRLDGIESAVARTILDVRAALEENTKGSGDALDRVGERLVGLTERLGVLDEASDAVRAHLESIPSPTETAGVVTREVADVLSTFRTATEGRVAGVERDLAGVATNVNEIWMRARSIAQAIEELSGALDRQGSVVGERLDATDARVGEIVQGEQRTAQRLAEAEQRFIAAARAIDGERDQVMLQAFETMVDRLSHDERRLAKRLRGLIGRRKRDGAEQRSPAREPTPGGALETGTPVPETPHIDPVLPSPAPARPSKRTSAPKPKAAKKVSAKPSAKKNLKAPSGSVRVSNDAGTPERTTKKKAGAKKTARARASTAKRSRPRARAEGTKRNTAPQAPVEQHDPVRDDAPEKIRPDHAD